jgi:ribosome-binding ATPase YchF (GTP1/OBG family)
MKLSPTEDDGEDDCAATVAKNWPARPLTLRVQYPHNYPLETIPQFSLIHENNIWEFPSARVNRLMTILNQTATDELGMSSVLSCLYAARDYLDSEADPNEQTASTIPINSSAAVVTAKDDDDTDQSTVDTFSSSLITKSSNDEIAAAVKEGLDIAESFLNLSMASVNSENIHRRTVTPSSMGRSLGGGSFGTYTMGLVGKPSAGKSTFFNVATAFSRQRGQRQRSDGDNTFNKNGSKFEGVSEESEWGGASMAAHPFTTIDPNIGYCLVPAPQGSCPEDYFIDKDPSAVHKFGSTHGRDPNGRRFLPVLLKDVAGLVPGAYQGRGRGNQFLNDLTDATVLIHVVDASGTSDAGGNKTVVTGQDGDEYSDPMNDLAWIRNELVEWVFSNLLAKWEVVSRKGKTKLAGMFSGYGQKEAVIDQLLVSLETFMEERYGLDRIYDKMTSWSEADVHRLVSLFLGVRFPMALCLNKIDLPSAKAFVEDIQSSLPIHGAYVGTPLAAKKEMLFVRNHLRPSNVKDKDSSAPSSPPTGVWECLSSALMLQEPVLVFPVSDLSTLAPLPGLSKVAVEDPSLPSKGMIRCIKSAGGIVPTCWNVHDQSYNMPSHSNSKDRDTSQSLNGQKDGQQLRDVLLMRPGSTVEDVFFALKRLGGLGGEFVRAEAFSGRPGGSKPKPIPKHELITAETCVIKIMSNKKSSWQ